LALPRRDKSEWRAFAGSCRPSQGRLSGVDGLGSCGFAVLTPVVEGEGQVVLVKDLPSGPRGRGITLAPRHALWWAPAMPMFCFRAELVLEPEVGRE